MLENNLIYIVSLSQLFLISYYYANKLHKRMTSVMEQYPAAEYPKLYPQPVEFYHQFHRKFRIIHRLIFWVGLAVVLGLWFDLFAIEQKMIKIFPMFYFFVQMFPIALLEFSEYGQFKLMRKANASPTRKADLQPRRFFDYISPIMFGLTLAVFVVAICLDAYWSDFNFAWGSDAMVRATTLTLGNAFFGGIIYWNIFGKKLNPHQSSKDRTSHITAVVKSFALTSIAMSTFLTINAAGDIYDIHAYKPAFISIYLQMIAVFGLGTMLNTLRLEDMDFDVYKKDLAKN